MKRRAATLLLALATLSAVLMAVTLAAAQEEGTLDAHRRRFSDVGAGFRAIRRGPDGTYFILAATPVAADVKPSKRSKASAGVAPAVLVFDSEGRKLRQVASQPGELVSPSSLDLDPSGRIYIADQSANSVSVYTPDGKRFARFAIPEPLEIVALPGDRFAVSSATSARLIAVYDLRGTLLREIGQFADLSDDPELNQRLNAGHLASDRAGNVYFAFRYAPEPTVRKYDSSSGYMLDEMTLNTLDLQPAAQSARQQIARMASGKSVLPHEIISAFGLDPDTQEYWLALGNLLMYFDNADNNVASNRVYTTAQARLVPNFILPEKDDVLLGNDPLGIYEIERRSSEKIVTTK